MYKKVTKVKPISDYNVIVTFENNKNVLYDAKELFKYSRLKKLKDKRVFKKSCKVMNETLAFDISGNNDERSCFDIAPDMLYKLPKYKEAKV